MRRRDYNVRIYDKIEIFSLEVVVPRSYTGDFIVRFGEEFADNGVAKKVDDYYSHRGGWHIKLSVKSEQKERLYDFIRNFCKEKNLPFLENC